MDMITNFFNIIYLKVYLYLPVFYCHLYRKQTDPKGIGFVPLVIVSIFKSASCCFDYYAF